MRLRLNNSDKVVERIQHDGLVEFHKGWQHQGRGPHRGKWYNIAIVLIQVKKRETSDSFSTSRTCGKPRPTDDDIEHEEVDRGGEGQPGRCTAPSITFCRSVCSQSAAAEVVCRNASTERDNRSKRFRSLLPMRPSTCKARMPLANE